MAYKVAIIDKDIEYAYELKKQIDKYYKEIELDIFEDLKEYKTKYTNQNKRFDLTLINSEIKTNDEIENAIIIEEMKDNSQFFKYRKLDSLVNDIKENLVVSDKLVRDDEEKEKIKIITTYSPYGEDISFRYANKIINFFSESSKIFFLNLAMFFTEEEKDEKKGMNAIDAIYNTNYLNDITFTKNVKHKNANLDMFYSLDNPYELLKINGSDLERLIEKIKEFNYKYIVINIDSKIDELSLKIFEKSNFILTFFKNNRVKIQMFYNLISSLEESKKVDKKVIEIKHIENEKRNFENIKRILSNI